MIRPGKDKNTRAAAINKLFLEQKNSWFKQGRGNKNTLTFTPANPAAYL